MVTCDLSSQCGKNSGLKLHKTRTRADLIELDASTEQLKRIRIHPVNIREVNDHWPRNRETENLSDQRVDHQIPLPPWREVWDE